MELQRQILDAARKLLMEAGYERLSMRRIAREVGITATTIYLYFHNKEALFEALVDEGMDRLYDALSEARRGSPQGAEAIAAMAESYIRFGLSNREYYEVMFMAKSYSVQRISEQSYRRGGRNLELFVDEVQRAAPHGGDENYLRAIIAWTMLHGGVSLLIAQRMDARLPTDVFTARLVATVVRTCLDRGAAVPAAAAALHE